MHSKLQTSYVSGSPKVAWPGQPDSPAVELGIIDSVNPRPVFLPPSVPADLADRLVRLHGDPIVWWVAQFVKFMMRPQSGLQEVLDTAVESQKLERPVVGVHVRRTDKVRQSLANYLKTALAVEYALCTEIGKSRCTRLCECCRQAGQK